MTMITPSYVIRLTSGSTACLYTPEDAFGRASEFWIHDILQEA